MSTSPSHLNSLGFAIGGRQARALIAWGLDEQGARIRIDDAKRGGAQGLRCECGAALVAKKGEIREHHFAHKAGDVRHCETAAAAAVANFISNTLLDGRRVALPVTAGILSHAQVLAVGIEHVASHRIHLIDAQRDRRLAVFARVRRERLEPLHEWCENSGVSGIVIDLTAYRNRSDEEISRAIVSGAYRRWLFRNPKNDDQAGPQFKRRLLGLRR